MRARRRRTQATVGSTVQSTSSLLRDRFLRVRDRVRVLVVPADAHPATPLLERLLRGHLEVLADDLQLAALVKLNDEPRDHPDVRDVADAALFHVQAVRHVGHVQDAYLLRPDRHTLSVALDYVRHPD